MRLPVPIQVWVKSFDGSGWESRGNLIGLYLNGSRLTMFYDLLIEREFRKPWQVSGRTEVTIGLQVWPERLATKGRILMRCYGLGDHRLFEEMIFMKLGDPDLKDLEMLLQEQMQPSPSPPERLTHEPADPAARAAWRDLILLTLCLE